MALSNRRDGSGGRRGRSSRRGRKALGLEPLEGRRLLNASNPVATGALPDLVPVSIQADGQADWGTSLSIRGELRNQGAEAAGPFRVDLYVSTTPDPTQNAVKIGSVEAAGVGEGSSFAFDEEFDLPPVALQGVPADGAVFVGMVVDAGGQVAESNEANNSDVARGIDSTLVLITPEETATLEAQSLEFSDGQPRWGETVAVRVRVVNTSGAPAPASTARVVLTPPGQAPGGSGDVTLLGEIEVPELLPLESRQVVGEVTLPPGPPTGFPDAASVIAFVRIDAEHDVNPMLQPLNLQGRAVDWEILAITPEPDAQPSNPDAPKPDLTAADVLVPGATLIWGREFKTSVAIQNEGAAASGPLNVRFVLAGPNGEMNNALVLGDAVIEGGLAPGASTTIEPTLKLPGKLPFDIPLSTGLGRIVAIVDPENAIDEAEEDDNTASVGPITLQLPTPEAPGLGGQPAPNPQPSPNPQPTPNPTFPVPNPVARQERLRRIQEQRSRLQALRAEMAQRRLEHMERLQERLREQRLRVVRGPRR